MKKHVLGSLACLAVAATACGSETEDAMPDGLTEDGLLACPAPPRRCDGDPVGFWVVEEACDPVVDLCAEQTLISVQEEDPVQGGVSISADGTADWTAQAGFELRAESPTSCLSSDLRRYCTSEDLCAYSTGASTALGGDGSWSTSDGQTLITVESGDETTTIPFCVDGDLAVATIEMVVGENDGITLRMRRQ